MITPGTAVSDIVNSNASIVTTTVPIIITSTIIPATTVDANITIIFIRNSVIASVTPSNYIAAAD